MTSREKILIALMIAAIGYGAFELLSGSLLEDTDPESYVAEIEDISLFSQEVVQVLEDEGLDPAEVYILELASRDWGRNFFYKRPSEAEVTTRDLWVEEEIEPMTYDGYIEMGHWRIAIINNKEYQEGELLAETGYRIITISPEEVLIESVGDDRQKSIPYAEKMIDGD